MHVEHIRHHDANAAEADDDRARCCGVGFISGSHVAHFDALRKVMANAGKQRRYREANCSNHLPERGITRLDQSGACAGGEHNQGRFGWARHQHAGFGGNAGAHATDPQQRRCHDGLDDDDPDDSGDQRLPVRGDHCEVETHADTNQEYAEREPLERRGDAFNFIGIIGFGDQQAGNQRTDDG